MAAGQLSPEPSRGLQVAAHAWSLSSISYGPLRSADYAPCLGDPSPVRCVRPLGNARLVQAMQNARKTSAG
jgi:hypothetical protein